MEILSSIENIRRNYVINGNFDFWQRGIGVLGLAPGGSDRVRLADRWSSSNFFVAGGYTVGQSTDVPAASQSQFSFEASVNSTISFGSTNHHFLPLAQRILGLDSRDFFNEDITLQFWVKSTIAGDYSVAFGNDLDSSSTKYVDTYTVEQANVWEQKVITLRMDQYLSTFARNNTQGFYVAFPIASGSARVTSNKGQWLNVAGATTLDTANRTDMMNAGNSIKFADIMLMRGKGKSRFQRAGRTYDEEQKLCYKFFYRETGNIPNDASWSGLPSVGVVNNGSTWQTQRVEFPVEMRAIPSASWSNGNNTLWWHVHNVETGPLSLFGGVTNAATDKYAYSWYGTRANGVPRTAEVRLRLNEWVQFDAEL